MELEMNRICVSVKKYSLLNYIVSILIILLPFLYQYKGIGNIISFGELIIIPFLIYMFVKKIFTKKLLFDKFLFLFYFVVLITTLFNVPQNYFNIGNSTTVFIRLVYYGLLIWLARDYFCFELVKKFYYALILIFAIYLIIQFFYNKVTGGYLPIYISENLVFAPESRGSLDNLYKFIFRPSSLFLEPSYYALFCLPGLCLMFFEMKNIKHFIFLVIVLFSIFLSSSVAGLIGSLVIIILWLFLKKTKNKNVFFIKLLTIIVLLFVFVLLSNFIFDSAMAQRISEGGSFNQRIGRGFLIYNELPFYNKIFGVGLNNLSSFMEYNGIYTVYDEANLDYCSSMIQILNYSGVFGFAFYIIYLFSLFIRIRKINYLNRPVLYAYLIVIIFISSYESILFMYRFAFIIIIFEGYYRYLLNINNGK